MCTNVTTQASINIHPNSYSQIKCKIKLNIGSDKQTIHFIPKVMENMDDELSFSESILSIKCGRTHLLLSVTNPTKNSILLKKGVIGKCT